MSVDKDMILDVLDNAGLGMDKIRKTVGKFKEDIALISKYNLAAMKSIEANALEDCKKILDSQREILDKFEGLKDFII